jgi:hypothetical protein
LFVFLVECVVSLSLCCVEKWKRKRFVIGRAKETMTLLFNYCKTHP